MKNNLLFFLLVFLGGQSMNAQAAYVPTYNLACWCYEVHNNIEPGGLIAGTKLSVAGLVGRVAMGSIETSFDNIERYNDYYLNTRYQQNSFDQLSDKANLIKSAAMLSLGAYLSTITTTLPYLTQNKRDFIQQVSTDKAFLYVMQLIDFNTIDVGSRQESYRLRRSLIKELSSNDKLVFKEMMPTIIVSIFINLAAVGAAATLFTDMMDFLGEPNPTNPNQEGGFME